ncbi:hypothetical protein [Flavobacterium terrisoli]|uniref:hypothetical protein n=1 Tax=Flavobacterium terrisoli TaxID=3242195 RepID=UPI0025437F47|nr:hypothetical protein [Flavobacterium buctense]
MKTKIITLSVLSLMSITTLFAQDRTTVSAYNSEISDNLDLRAVASIFGDSRDLADFERRLNDPQAQISNLDLNEDNQVDYLRVIETVEGNAHLIVIQSVLGRDTFQDVATVEVERDRYNKVQVQVVGDVYMYGPNYIYEPVYSYTPVIYASFWVGSYRPYYSSWYWGYYPSYYYAWSPCPIFRYRNHIGITINFNHHYNYVNYRRCEVAYNGYYRGGRRGNAYEVRYPNRSFQVRNTGYANRRELDQNRNIRTVGTRELASNSPRSNTRANANTRSESPRGNGNTRSYESPRGNGNNRNESPRAATSNGNTRSYESPRGNGNNRNESPRAATSNGNTRSYEAPRGNSNQRSESPRSVEPRGNSRSYANQGQSPRAAEPRGNAGGQREMSSPRGNSGGQRAMTSPRGNSGGQREMSSPRGNSGGGQGSNQRGNSGNRRS